ncbi:MAG: sialidase family protein [Draconibacterium sp.]|nr:sialidase family protein [Draconibacterium sp.]
MNRLIIIIVAAFWGLCSCSTLNKPAKSGLNNEFFEVQQLFTDERFPNVVVAMDGIVVTSWGRKNFRVKRSVDGGKTWAPEINVANPGFQGGGMIVDENSGDILLFVEEGHPVSPLTMYRSKDHGLTWKAEKTKILPNSFGHIPSMHMNEHGTTLKIGKYAGRLIRPTRYYFGGNGREFWDEHYTNAMYSDDGGKTWQASEPFPANGTGEATLVELSDGTIYYNSRRHKSTDGLNPRRRYEARSTDGGKTWKDMRLVEELPDGDQHRDYGLMAGLARLPFENHDVLLFSNIESKKGRKNGVVWASFDGGKTWPVKRVVDKGSFAYSSMTVGRKGTPSESFIYLLYESDGGAKIARFNLDWILEGKQLEDFLSPK